MYVFMLSAFEVRSIQAAKSKSSSCPGKKPSRELWPICQALLASKLGKRELVLDLKTYFLYIYCIYFPACARCHRLVDFISNQHDL